MVVQNSPFFSGCSESLCAQVHTPVHSHPHMIEGLCIHHCTPVTKRSTTLTQSCAMVAETTLPSSTVHSHPSSPKSLYPHSYTSTMYSRSCLLHIQHPDLPSAAASTTAPLLRLPTSCAHMYLHVLTSPCVPDMSHHHTTILSQQQL